jgi:thiol-disulfide isomerase/thioredoxin
MRKTLSILVAILWIGYFARRFMHQWPDRNEIAFAGNYVSYEQGSGMIDSDKVTVLDFYASRCPSCRAAHKNIVAESNQLPKNLQILNVDYDTNKDLRDKYWVTSQHTFVLVDRNGNKIKSIQWLNHVSEIIDFVWSEVLNPIIPQVMTGEILTGYISQTGDNINTGSDEVTTTPLAGIYTDYEWGKKYISDPSKKVVLFFHASRCPSCKQAEKDILKNKDMIDSNLIILKVDYDTATELKKQYSITSQTSYVLLNTDGTLNKKSIGMTSLEDIEKFVL